MRFIYTTFMRELLHPSRIHMQLGAHWVRSNNFGLIAMSVVSVSCPRPVAAGPMGLSRAVECFFEYWRSLGAAMFDHYHPEMHYMRGPGPKWRDKHAATTNA